LQALLLRFLLLLVTMLPILLRGCGTQGPAKSAATARGRKQAPKSTTANPAGSCRSRR
jgi:hypothetical protein